MRTPPTPTQPATGIQRVAALHAQMVRAQCRVPRIHSSVLALRQERNAALSGLRRAGYPLSQIFAALPLTAYDIVDLSRVWEKAGCTDDSEGRPSVIRP